MAHHKSAQKRIIQNLKRKMRNKSIKSAVRTKIKQLRLSIENSDAQAKNKLKTAIVALHKAATKGVIPRKRASRLTSRLTKAVNKMA